MRVLWFLSISALFLGCTSETGTGASSTGYLELDTGEECTPDDTYRVKSNNGHGNNIDGVDSSNPGKSKQGLDSDPNVDDERKHHPGKGKAHKKGDAPIPGCDMQGCCDDDMVPDPDDGDDEPGDDEPGDDEPGDDYPPEEPNTSEAEPDLAPL